MSGRSKPGKYSKVTLGASEILGMGSVTLGGQANEMLDVTEFTDVVKFFEVGLRDGGTVSIEGIYKADDNTGQTTLRRKFLDGDDITDLRIYINSTSYYEPCRTSGYRDPTSTTGGNTVLSYVNVQSHEFSTEKAGIGKWSCTFKVSGDMVLV